ncbi:MAG: phosphatase PAP2 family protein [Bacteroidota bacterium]
MRGLLVVIWGVAVLGAQDGHAQQVADPFRFLRWPVEDTRAALQGVLTPRGLVLAGSVAGTLLLVPLDERIGREIGQAPRKIGLRSIEEVGNPKVIRPLGTALFVGALLSGNERFQDASFTALESVVMANFITNGLKLVFGRSRPSDDDGPYRFIPIAGGTSFPSGHTTTAFAFVTPWVWYYPSVATPMLWGLAAGTATTRMLTRRHWLSDVVAGAFIGTATATLLSWRHQGQAADFGWAFRPVAGGGSAQLTFSW